MPSRERIMFEIISEERIKAAADFLSGTDNSFAKLLGYGEEFKAVDLTPIYIIDNKTADVYVTSAERMQKSFH
jgi:hypothetical protein